MAEEIAIRLPDGSNRVLTGGTTARDLAASIGSRLAKAAVIAVVNGEERDLGWSLTDGDEVAIVTPESPQGLFTIRHSTAHVLAQAVLDLFPGATFGIGPPVEDGFYYDFALPDGGTFVEEDLPRIETRMREIMAEAQPFVRDEIPAARAREIFARPPLQARDHRRRLHGPHVGHLVSRCGPHLREPATRSGSLISRSSAIPDSSTCAGARTSRTPSSIWATSS